MYNYQSLERKAYMKKYLKNYYNLHKCKLIATNKAYEQQHKKEIAKRKHAYYLKHRAYLLEYAHLDRQKNRKRHGQTILQWQRANKSHLAQYRKRYRLNNLKEIREYYRRYALQYAAIRRTRKEKTKGFFTFEEWEILKGLCNYKCQNCFKKEPRIKLTVDHIKPISKGGSSFITNIQPLCKRCNSSKGNRTI